MNMTGIIFSELYSDKLSSFTYDRNMAAIPFGGRYRMVDFVLSNMVNSGIANVGVLATQHYQSLMEHLNNAQQYDLNRKNGGLQILPPFATQNAGANHRGKMDDLRNALDYLETISTTPYVLLADAYVVCNIDYRPALENHIASGADILNVSGAAETPAIVRHIREQFPDVPIIATGGPTEESILETIRAGANAITYTPPTNGSLFAESMRRYRSTYAPDQGEP